MKIEFIKRGAATRLILIFAGWSTDSRYYSDCIADGWDTAVVSDYRDMTMPPLPEQYQTVYIFAYSLGVFAASMCAVPAAVRVAICGSPLPVSDQFGIKETVYAGTLDGLNERSLTKFHLRMAGDKATFESIKPRLPEYPDILRLKEELIAIRNYAVRPDSCIDGARFHRAYIAEDDRIFPMKNLRQFWSGCRETEMVFIKAPHAVDIASVVRSCLPDTGAIGEGFSRAGKSYNENAVVQKEICDKICERMNKALSALPAKTISLLEIGPGSGLLTGMWSRLLTPDRAIFVDLSEMPEFGVAKDERYVISDAEKWLEETDEKFDVILSASAIQWFADPVRFVSVVRNHLNPGGFAILSTFVKGNLGQLDALRPSPIIYRSADEYKNIPGVHTEEWERTLRFSSSREMMMHLRLTGVSPKRRFTLPYVSCGDSAAASCVPEASPHQLTYRPLILFVSNKNLS